MASRRLIRTRRIIIYGLMLACLYLLSQADFFINMNPLWTHKESKYFKVYYQRGSPAQAAIEELADMLDEYYADLDAIFEIPVHEKIPYYYHNRQLYSGLNPIWGYTTDYSIHAVYSKNQSDTSPHELRHFIQDMVNKDAPYFFNEGACGIGIKIGGVDFHRKAKLLCSHILDHPLDDLVLNFKKFDRSQDYLAYSFVEFLVERYGKAKFGRFYSRIKADSWPQVMQDVYGKSFKEIESDWKNFLCLNS